MVDPNEEEVSIENNKEIQEDHQENQEDGFSEKENLENYGKEDEKNCQGNQDDEILENENLDNCGEKDEKISELSKKSLFIQHILEMIGMKLDMLLCNNFSTSQRTKQIDILKHFIRGYIEDDIFKVELVRSKDNDADTSAKNATEDVYMKHSSKMVEIPPK